MGEITFPGEENTTWLSNAKWSAMKIWIQVPLYALNRLYLRIYMYLHVYKYAFDNNQWQKKPHRLEEEWGRYMGGFEGRQGRGKCSKNLKSKNIKVYHLKFKNKERKDMFIEHFVTSMNLYDNYYRQSRSKASSSLWDQETWTDCISVRSYKIST